jgi:Acetyltransferase (GNAT) domain
VAAQPLFEEMSFSAAGPMVSGLAGLPARDPHAPLARETKGVAGVQRRLSVYSGHAAFALASELEHLSLRAIEPNVYFNPRFLAPAIPRLDEREIRLAVLRDEEGVRSRLRLLMPYSIERLIPGGVGLTVMRSWATVFGPNGTPLIDGDDPASVADEFLDMLSRPHLGLPGVLVIPQIYGDGPAARVLRAAALLRDFPVYATAPVTRAMLETDLDAEDYLASVFTGHHRRGYARQLRRLGDKGAVEFTLTRDPDGVFRRMEEFLLLEARGWKGRKRTAMISDRMQAAFARETVNGMAARDRVRMMTLDLDGRAIASLIILIENGVGHTWKIAFDEAHAAASPGMQLMIEATKYLIEDPNIVRADSCAVPDHPMMDRIWSARAPVETLVIGLGPDRDKQARAALAQLQLKQQTRSAARSLRDRLRGWFKA